MNAGSFHFTTEDLNPFVGTPTGRTDIYPYAGDWNGDGIDTIGWFRQSEGSFRQRNEDGTTHSTFVGAPGARTDIYPYAGDWDGYSAPPPAGCEHVTAPADPSESAVAPGTDIRVHMCLTTRLSQMVAAAQADGLTLGGWNYRSNAQQIELRKQHCGTSQYAIYEMPASQCNPPTAVPGTSRPEFGLAVDFTCNGSAIGNSGTSPCFLWLKSHAAAYGFKNLPSENWHWSADGH
jgi:hypothetical protein